MTNTDAVRIIAETLNWFRSALDKGVNEIEIYERLSDVTTDWSLQPELGNIATILVKAWAEERPESTLARKLLLEHLGGLGSVDELAELDAGSGPRSLLSAVDAIPELRKRLFEAGERMKKAGRR